MATKKETKKEADTELMLKPQHELFCQYYVKNSSTRGNATHAYAESHGVKLDELSREDAKYITMSKGKESYQELVESSSYDKAINICGVQGNRLLRSFKIQDRIRKLFNEMLTDEFVDGELSKVVAQDHDLSSKMAAVREFNKLKARITDRIQHSGEVKFSKMEEMSNEDLAKLTEG